MEAERLTAPLVSGHFSDPCREVRAGDSLAKTEEPEREGELPPLMREGEGDKTDRHDAKAGTQRSHIAERRGNPPDQSALHDHEPDADTHEHHRNRALGEAETGGAEPGEHGLERTERGHRQQPDRSKSQQLRPSRSGSRRMNAGAR